MTVLLLPTICADPHAHKFPITIRAFCGGGGLLDIPIIRGAVLGPISLGPWIGTSFRGHAGIAILREIWRILIDHCSLPPHPRPFPGLWHTLQRARAETAAAHMLRWREVWRKVDPHPGALMCIFVHLPKLGLHRERAIEAVPPGQGAGVFYSHRDRGRPLADVEAVAGGHGFDPPHGTRPPLFSELQDLGLHELCVEEEVGLFRVPRPELPLLPVDLHPKTVGLLDAVDVEAPDRMGFLPGEEIREEDHEGIGDHQVPPCSFVFSPSRINGSSGTLKRLIKNSSFSSTRFNKFMICFAVAR